MRTPVDTNPSHSRRRGVHRQIMMSYTRILSCHVHGYDDADARRRVNDIMYMPDDAPSEPAVPRRTGSDGVSIFSY